MNVESSNLIQQLKDPNRVQRVAAARALVEHEDSHAITIPALINALNDIEVDVRLAALESLHQIWRSLVGPGMDPSLTESETDRWLGPLTRAFRKLLTDENKYVRVGAAEGLRDLYLGDDVVFAAFLQAARDVDESLRRRAALALWLGVTDRRAPLTQVGTEAGVAALVELTKDPSKQVQNYALRALGSLGAKANAAAPAVLLLLQEDDEEVRFNAALALAGCDSDGQHALPILVKALTDGDRLKRKAAAFAIRRLGPEAKAVLPNLINGLHDHEKRVRARCAGTLGLIGTEVGDEGVLALLDAEGDADFEVRSAVQQALEAIGQEFVAAVRTRSAGHQARDAFPLFGFQPEAIPGLSLMLHDSDPNIRAYAATALGHLRAKEAVPGLINLLQDEDADVRRRAAQALQLMGIKIEANDPER